MSAKQIEYHQGAIADVKSAVTWYRNRSPKAALDFIAELQRAADTIREAPERWPPAKNNTRRFLLWRFPFSILYSEGESAITIWAVAHGSRRPEFWTGRL
jgi:toxin ParE1/3/4